MGMLDAVAYRIGRGETVEFRPAGDSMAPLIHSRQRVRVAPVDAALVEPGDIALARVSGTVYLHRVSAVDTARRRVQIANNRGRVNGWTGRDRVFGICLDVDGVARPGAAAKVRRPPVPAVRAEPLSTRRMELLPLRVGHAGEMARVLGDPVLHESIGGAPLAAGALRERYARLAAGSPGPAVVWCNWLLRLREDGPLVGTVQATVTPGRDTAETAWVIGTPWQGRGLATEAALAVTAWLARLPVGLLVAHIHPDHHASAAVAAACGLAPTPHREDGEIRWERRTGSASAAGS
ncbi:GNAT family N-acetyltransferase [Streptomyces vinaceus]|uniref:GNAT family N-acetyltransferase n=1 Tax=Streptomyces vinaceus TaxID=1960 RepID=UPI003800AEF6